MATSRHLAKAKQANNILIADGWQQHQACGIIANIEAESSFNEDAVGDHGTAFGLCQWHPDRQKNFKNHFGHNIQDSTFDEQVRFITFEMTKGTETHAGNRLKKADTPSEAGVVVCKLYERPSDPTGSVSAHRGSRADDWCRVLP